MSVIYKGDALVLLFIVSMSPKRCLHFLFIPPTCFGDGRWGDGPPLMQLETLLALSLDQHMAENQAAEDRGFLCPYESEAVPIGSGRSGARVHEAWM